MIFADLFFLYAFLPACLLFYFLNKNVKYKNAVLIVFSLIFYAWGEPKAVLLLILSSIVNWRLGIIIEKNSGKSGKAALGCSLAFNLGILAIFKYLGFIVSNLNHIPGISLHVPDIKLPIGISFYTLQIISYAIDCYRGKTQAQTSYFRFLLYASLFPKLIAGPIVRYSEFENEIDSRKSSVSDLYDGTCRFIIGLAKKVILANRLWTIVEAFFSGDISDLSVFATWYTAILYAMYVYFELGGYSDMAIGLAQIFGFHFNDNFRYPFICRNIADFWQRWHISLGEFFRDYILDLSIGGKIHAYFNMFLVWFCIGIWHGASWNYIIWGLYLGAFVFFEQIIEKKRMKAFPAVIAHVYSKLVIVIGFGIFYFKDLSQLGNFFRNLVGANGNAFIDTVSVTSLANNCFLIAAAILACFPISAAFDKFINKNIRTVTVGQIVKAVCCLGLLVVSSLLLVGAAADPYLNFKF